MSAVSVLNEIAAKLELEYEQAKREADRAYTEYEGMDEKTTHAYRTFFEAKSYSDGLGEAHEALRHEIRVLDSDWRFQPVETE